MEINAAVNVLNYDYTEFLDQLRILKRAIHVTVNGKHFALFVSTLCSPHTVSLRSFCSRCVRVVYDIVYLAVCHLITVHHNSNRV